MSDPMDISTTSVTTSSSSAPSRDSKSHELVTHTIKKPPYSYVHIEMMGDGLESMELDDLQVKSYCNSALKQFLGVTGTAIAVDILKVEEGHFWVRLPREDLGAFAAAITAWNGTNQNGNHYVTRIRGCADWLGSLVGRDGQDKVWAG